MSYRHVFVMIVFTLSLWLHTLLIGIFTCVMLAYSEASTVVTNLISVICSVCACDIFVYYII